MPTTADGETEENYDFVSAAVERELEDNIRFVRDPEVLKNNLTATCYQGHIQQKY